MLARSLCRQPQLSMEQEQADTFLDGTTQLEVSDGLRHHQLADRAHSHSLKEQIME